MSLGGRQHTRDSRSNLTLEKLVDFVEWEWRDQWRAREVREARVKEEVEEVEEKEEKEEEEEEKCGGDGGGGGL